MLKKLLIKVWLWLKYPNKLRESIVRTFRTPQKKKLGIHTYPPNYLYFNTFNEKSVILDVGCGFKAEFSCHLIEKYNLKSFGIDPTHKHKRFLKEIEEKYNGCFKHIEVALSKTNSTLTFYETQENESGSLLQDHQNILKDTIVSYPVESKNIQTLLSDLGLSNVSLLKIDIEGAEYELLKDVSRESLKMIEQIFIEFHHHAFKTYRRKDTNRIVRTIKKAGFNCFTLDGNNYLFYLPGTEKKYNIN